jgi:hypothetical protein
MGLFYRQQFLEQPASGGDSRQGLASCIKAGAAKAEISTGGGLFRLTSP